MNQREKTLTAVVSLMVVAVGLVFMSRRVSGLFDRRNNQVMLLERTVRQQQGTVRRGALAEGRLKQYEARSLPGNLAKARSLYSGWLSEHAVDAGFAGVNVSPLAGHPHGEVFYQHGFMVSGNGDLRQLTEFLHSFYSAGFLHRVSRLNAKPIPRTKRLDLSITVEALAMNRAADRTELEAPPPAGRLAREEMTEYVNTIVGRNMFAPANISPEFSTMGAQTGHPGRTLRVRLRASDSDQEDQLSYSLEGSTLEGAQVNAASGELEWTPAELGEYEVSVRVTDNGLPPRSDTLVVKISVVEPPAAAPVKLDFDSAEHSVLTGITENSGERQAWVTLRTEGRVLQLYEGDELSIGSVKGIVSRISRSEAEITTEDGQSIVVGLGESLRG